MEVRDEADLQNLAAELNERQSGGTERRNEWGSGVIMRVSRSGTRSLGRRARATEWNGVHQHEPARAAHVAPR